MHKHCFPVFGFICSRRRECKQTLGCFGLARQFSKLLRSGARQILGALSRLTLHITEGMNAHKCISTQEQFSGHTLLDIDATIWKPGFKPPISMKSIQAAS